MSSSGSVSTADAEGGAHISGASRKYADAWSCRARGRGRRLQPTSTSTTMISVFTATRGPTVQTQLSGNGGKVAMSACVWGVGGASAEETNAYRPLYTSFFLARLRICYVHQIKRSTGYVNQIKRNTITHIARNAQRARSQKFAAGFQRHPPP